MTTVSTDQAKHELPSLLQRVREGEVVVIADEGKTPVRLISLPAVPTSDKPRRPGLARGRIRIASNFDDPLPDDLQQYFEGRTKDLL